MSSFSARCARTASLLALATLPNDRSLRDPTLKHDDFTAATGYIRRSVNGVICHGVDWDGTPGIEAVVRENGVRSAALFREFRSWRTSHNSSSLVEHGNQACAFLAKHFGPYDKATSEALQQRRELENNRAQLISNLEKEFPLAVRSAAHEHLSPQLAYSVRAPLAPLATFAPLTPRAIDLSANSFTATNSQEQPSPALFLRNEAILWEFIQSDKSLASLSSLEEAAKTILERCEAREKQIDGVDLALSLFRLPAIPGERKPADVDLIEYGALICRHRAVVVATLLAETGYQIELVEGTVTRHGHSGGHLFIYSEEAGILEPSAEGPEFWRKTVSIRDDSGQFSVLVDSETRYIFGHRTPMSSH